MRRESKEPEHRGFGHENESIHHDASSFTWLPLPLLSQDEVRPGVP